MEKEISLFKIHKADATYEKGVLKVRLFYPRNITEENKKFPENLRFGISVIEKLLARGHAEIADLNNPFRPADGGSVYVFNDGVILFHRRDRGAPQHRLYHGVPGGYTQELDSTFSEQGLLQTGLRETAEENLLITRERNPWSIVPNDSRDYTLKALKSLGLSSLKPRYINIETLPSRDELEVFFEDGEHIFSSKGKGFLDFQWEAATSFTLLQIRRVPLSSQEVLPIDAEGFWKGDKYIHFNRESYFVPLTQLENKSWGTPLTNPKVYQTRIDGNHITIYHSKFTEPYYGPDEKIVTHPHIFAPEDKLTTCLDALGVLGYAGRKLEIELWKEKCMLEKKSIIPEEFLIKG